MTPPANKPVKARRMWATPDYSRIESSKIDIGFTREAHRQAIPVAVLDVSDTDRLVDQAANALNGPGVALHDMSGIDQEGYREGARAVLRSLGVIK